MTNSHSRYPLTENSILGGRQSRPSCAAPNRMSIAMILNDSEPEPSDAPSDAPNRHLILPVNQHGELQIRPRHIHPSRPSQSLTPSYPHSGYAQAQRQHWQDVPVLSPQAPLPRSPNRNQGPRPPRHRYAIEEYYFVWYHRIDLAWPWDRIEDKFRRYFHMTRSRGGLQCKLYRILEDYGVRIREQYRSTRRRGSDEYTARVNFTDHFDVRFPWMLQERGAGVH